MDSWKEDFRKQWAAASPTAAFAAIAVWVLLVGILLTFAWQSGLGELLKDIFLP